MHISQYTDETMRTMRGWIFFWIYSTLGSFYFVLMNVNIGGTSDDDIGISGGHDTKPDIERRSEI